ncbi:MAG: leucine-rich repeat domain-containing protein [Prevotella sp.]|nr:leucine-rich repeat domain-containing protein [Prevotella sp.]
MVSTSNQLTALRLSRWGATDINMRQGILKSLLSVFFLTTCHTMLAHDFKEDGIYYNASSKTKEAYVTFYGRDPQATYRGSIVIPETVYHEGVTYRVVGIGDCAFRGSTISTVKLPNSIKSIGSAAFAETPIVSIDIPESVTVIDIKAFQDCKRLDMIKIPSRVSKIGEYAFRNCTKLWKIDIPNSVTFLGEFAFAYCENLQYVTLSKNTKRIDDGTFIGCVNLGSVEIPEGVKVIGRGAFENCKGLKTVVIPNSVESCDYFAFRGCENLRSITIPRGKKSDWILIPSNCVSSEAKESPEEIRKREEIAKREEAQRQERERKEKEREQLRQSAFQHDPVILALKSLKKGGGMANMFDYDLYLTEYNSGFCKLRLYIKPTKRTKELSKRFWECYEQARSNEASFDSDFIMDGLNEIFAYVNLSLMDVVISGGSNHRDYKFQMVGNPNKKATSTELIWPNWEVIGWQTGASPLQTTEDGTSREQIICGSVNLGDVPFLQKTYDKGKFLFFMDFRLPYSDMYAITANGKKKSCELAKGVSLPSGRSSYQTAPRQPTYRQGTGSGTYRPSSSSRQGGMYRNIGR